MSSHEYRSRRNCRHLLIALGFVAAMTPVLSACSFQPLYGTTASGVSVQNELKSVSIAPIPGRVGQRLRNELIFHTTNGGDASASNYRLEVAIREKVSSILVTQAGDAQGQIYSLYASFKLVRLKDNKVVFDSRGHARAAYDTNQTVDGKQVNSIFSDIRARIDAENRVARTLADDIKTRVAAYLATSA